MTGKGDKRRPTIVSKTIADENYVLIHGTEEEKGKILMSRCPKNWLETIPCSDCSCVPTKRKSK
jgi:hypothetical protein